MLKSSPNIRKLAQKQLERLAKERVAAQATGLLKWEYEAKDRIERLRNERRVTYRRLSRLLEAQGISESPDQLNRKVNRMKFSAALYLACLHVIENVPQPEAGKNRGQ